MNMTLFQSKKKFLCLIVLIFLKSAFANENLNQIKIEADKSIEYFENQKIYIASGNAIASKGKFSIKAEKIKAFMDKIKTSNITKIEAKGKVIIVNDYTKARSNFAKYDFKKKFIILKGISQSIESKKFKINSNKFLSFDDINKVAKSEGDVRLLLKGPTSIFSEKINANFDKFNNILTAATAEGNVKIKTKLETITSDSAKYEGKTNLISLRGNVIIRKGDSILTGEKGYFNLNTRKSRIESGKSKRVKGVFRPSN